MEILTEHEMETLSEQESVLRLTRIWEEHLIELSDKHEHTQTRDLTDDDTNFIIKRMKELDEQMQEYRKYENNKEVMECEIYEYMSKMFNN